MVYRADFDDEEIIAEVAVQRTTSNIVVRGSNNMIKGIVFDMDNTLLRSHIDFEAMKNGTYQFLERNLILPADLALENHTTSTLIDTAVKTKKMTEKLLQEMWQIPRKYEVMGMKDAELEPGVVPLLDELSGKYRMVIVTNNSIDAARAVLIENGIYGYFDHVVGREMVGALKPSPDGFVFILQQHKDISLNEWISVGDSWMDGKAAEGAGIPFISYRGDVEKMNRMGVYPRADIRHIRDLLDFCYDDKYKSISELGEIFS